MPIFSVYVVELTESVCHRTACPSRDSGKPHVYGGETQQLTNAFGGILSGEER